MDVDTRAGGDMEERRYNKTGMIVSLRWPG